MSYGYRSLYALLRAYQAHRAPSEFCTKSLGRLLREKLIIAGWATALENDNSTGEKPGKAY